MGFFEGGILKTAKELLADVEEAFTGAKAGAKEIQAPQDSKKKEEDLAALKAIAEMKKSGATEVPILSVKGQNLTPPMRGGVEKGLGTAEGERISIDEE